MTEPFLLTSVANGACAIEASAIVLGCGGSVLGGDGGVSAGVWTATAGGGFTATVGGAVLTCTPS